MQGETGMPEGVCSYRGEWGGSKLWERCIRQRLGRGWIYFRFPVWEKSHPLNALLEEGMARLYRYACQRQREQEGLLAAAHYELLEDKKGFTVVLRGYVGPRDGYCLQEWATICLAPDGSWRSIRLGGKKKKKRKKGPKQGADC